MTFRDREPAALADLARRIVSAGAPGTLSTLFSTRGSTYRPLASMMVSVPGVRAGGISGGCLEDYVARLGEYETRTTPATMLTFHTHRDTDGGDIPVLGCGGAIEILVERLAPAHALLLEQLAHAAESDCPSTLACVVRRDAASLSVAREWLQGGGLCAIAADDRLGHIREEALRDMRSIHRMLSPDADLLLHYVPPLTRLVIFGAGDDAAPLCEMGASLGWHVSVADRRARLATTTRFPGAQTVIAGPWEEVVNAITFSPRTAVVLMTHDLDDDATVLSLLPKRPLAYLGALGPAHRRQWLLERASMLAITPDDRIARILRGPIGLDLGERSAAGIAVAVIAEILSHLNRRTARIDNAA
jgi:xanthine dehydrogenase accessory factor